MNVQTQAAMFSSATDEWETPWVLFDQLNAEFGPLTLDVCASGEGVAKCRNHFTPDMDGLFQEWFPFRCWMNPPYGRGIGKWIQRAHEQSLKGAFVVCLLPARTDTRWFHEIVKPHAAEVRFLKGRVKFGGCKNPAPFPSMVVTFGQR